MSAKSSFFAELQRRNVYKVGAMYAVSGWLIVQVATQVFPFFDVPNWAVRLVVLVIAAGFPVVLVLSWIYELTPQGIVKTDEVAPATSITRNTGQKLNRAIIAVLSVAVLVLLAKVFWPHAGAGPAEDTAGDKSIAVLPFENLSDDKSNAYFAAGIQDEILTRLAKIGALKVISRTSTAHYASSPDNLPEIAKELGVANILEGSVQKAGDAVHVNVQLIRAASDAHLWAETYDRKLDNIFAVEGEVAGTIAEQLNTTLTGKEQQALAQKPTSNPAAYDAYLRGLAAVNDGNSFTAQLPAGAAFEEAVRLDPDFALAWARLATTRSYCYFNGFEPAIYTAESVRAAADAAIRLQPASGEAQLAEGYYLYRVARDFPAALRAFQNAQKTLPGDAQVPLAIGLVERRQGLWEQSLAHLEQSAQLDPRNVGTMATIGGETLGALNRYDEDRTWDQRALAIVPGEPNAISQLVASYQAEGRLPEAAAVLRGLPQLGEDPLVAGRRSYQYLLERHYDQAIAELQTVLATPQDQLDGYGPQLQVYLALSQQAAGQAGAARATAQALVKAIEPQANQVDDTVLPVTLAQAYALAGRNDDALKQAQRAVELYRGDAIGLPVAQLVLAQVEALAGQHQAAVPMLRALLDTPDGLTPALLKLDPTWDSLRADPYFQKLVAEARLNTFRTAAP